MNADTFTIYHSPLGERIFVAEHIYRYSSIVFFFQFFISLFLKLETMDLHWNNRYFFLSIDDTKVVIIFSKEYRENNIFIDGIEDFNFFFNFI